jgi:hypothetical protein
MPIGGISDRVVGGDQFSIAGRALFRSACPAIGRLLNIPLRVKDLFCHTEIKRSATLGARE